MSVFLSTSGHSSKPWSELACGNRGGQQKRIARVRDALDIAAGGEHPAADDVAAVLVRTLAVPEQDALLRRLQGARKMDTTDELWVRLGKSLVKQILSSFQTMSMLIVLLCVALRGAGITSYGQVRRTMGITIPRKTWRRTHTMQKVEPLPARGNGRRGYRKLSANIAVQVLEGNSVESCQFLRRKKRSVSDTKGDNDKEEPELHVAKSLTDTKTQIYQCNECVSGTISKSTWMRYLKKDFCEFRITKRKLDVCKKCLQWDQQIHPSCVASFQCWREKLEALVPDYFQRFDADILPTLPADAQKNMRVEFAEAFLQYVDDHAKSRPKSTVKGALKLAGELHSAEAAVAHELRTKWSKVSDQTSIGLLPLLQMHSLHFAIRDRSKDINTEHRLHPADGTIYFQLDFKEHDTLPVGPEETGDFWYANARLGITVLGICVWSAVSGPTYHTYCSTVSEQSGLFAVACLQDLLSKLDLKPYSTAVLWADVGPHFRCGRMIGFWLAHVLREFRFQATQLIFFPEHHGKGIIDGHFGRMRMWLLTLAQSRVVATLQEYCDGMGERADHYRAQNPKAPQCKFHAFMPPPKASLPQTSLRTDMLRSENIFVKSTYFWSSAWVQRKAMIYAHAMVGEVAHAAVRPSFDFSEAVKKADGAKGKWKEYYRTQCPEKRVLNIGSLQKTWDRLADLGLEYAARRQPLHVRMASFSASMRRKQELEQAGRVAAKQRREKSGEKLDNADSSSDSDSSSSSSSSDSSSSCSSTQ